MVARGAYIPNQSDVVWLDFNPVRGHEQSGRRPALIISAIGYNAKSKLALVCPVTSRIKEYPFEVSLKTKAVEGVVLTDQIRSVAWKQRRAEKIGVAPEVVTTEVQEHIKKLIVE